MNAVGEHRKKSGRQSIPPGACSFDGATASVQARRMLSYCVPSLDHPGAPSARTDPPLTIRCRSEGMISIH